MLLCVRKITWEKRNQSVGVVYFASDSNKGVPTYQQPKDDESDIRSWSATFDQFQDQLSGYVCFKDVLHEIQMDIQWKLEVSNQHRVIDILMLKGLKMVKGKGMAFSAFSVQRHISRIGQLKYLLAAVRCHDYKIRRKSGCSTQSLVAQLGKGTPDFRGKRSANGCYIDPDCNK